MTPGPSSETEVASRAEAVHPAIADFMRENDGDGPAFGEMSIEEIREMDEENPLSRTIDIPVEHVEDVTVTGPTDDVPIRLYDPRTDLSQPTPAVVYIHGGGWISGSIETHDRVCRKLSTETGYPTVSVGYRLAPEHPFPAGLLDCYSVLQWLFESKGNLGIDPDRMVVAGDSAGGNLAAATALLARDRDGPSVAHQVLIYPAVGDARATQAYEENSEGYELTADIVDVIYERYTESDVDDANYYAWPRRARDLTGLPPATILTAGFDPLRDDGARYAKRLQNAGVPVSYTNYEELIHGFFAMIGDPVDIDRAHEAYAEIGTALEQQFQ